MTEIDAASLFYQMADMANNQLLGYISILSAFLVMSYFAADKLSNVLMVIVLALFSSVCILLIVQLNLMRNDMQGIYAYLIELRDAGASGLEWFGMNSSWFVRNIQYVINIVTFGGFAGCLLFFFYKRNSEDGAKST